jgi:hypothetical protein
MNVRLTLLFRSMCPALTISMIVLVTTGTAAVTKYLRTTQQLDLSQVTLVVAAPTELKEALRQRTLRHFQSAGLPLPGSGSPQAFRPATLTLALDPQPIGDLCPGKVLYAPSLTLTELVTIPRTDTVIQDYTWLFGPDQQVRNPIAAEQIEKDLDGLIDQFITDYQAANPPDRPKDMRATLGRDGKEPLSPVPNSDDRSTDRHLQDIRAVSLSVLADRGSSALKANAERQLAQAGVHTVPHTAAVGAVSLSLELTQQSLDDHCPGKVLYQRGLYLVEEVRIARRPRVQLWTDTWLRESVQIVPPLLPEELESDRRLLLQEFIRTHHAQ